jgi:chitin synthase
MAFNALWCGSPFQEALPLLTSHV